MQFVKEITGFTGGVSQQPTFLRSDTQCEELLNGFPSLVHGNVTRPPLEHVAVLSSQAAPGAFIHSINRDANEKYNMILTGNPADPLEVYTLDGVKCLVRYGHLDDDFVFTADAAVKGYLTSLSGKLPRESFKAVTVADHTLITNATKTCRMSDEADPTVFAHEAVAYVKKGVAATTYCIFIDGTLAAVYTTGDSTNYDSYKTNNIAAGLLQSLTSGNLITLDPTPGVYTYLLNAPPTGNITVKLNETVLNPVYYTVSQVNGQWKITFDSNFVTFSDGDPTAEPPVAPDVVTIIGSGLGASYNVTLQDNLIKIKKADGSPFTFRVSDSWGDQAMDGIYRRVQRYEDLPPRYFNGSVIEVTGDPTNNFDNFWVKFDASEGGSAGAWVETRKPGMKNAFDPATLPHRLVRTGINEFTFADIGWTERKVGDEVSCAEPSFIGQTVNDIFYYRNRLGFFAGENIILSKAGDFFTFWPTTATDSLDDDPIDVAASASEVAELFHAVPYEKTLLAFGEQIQIEFGAGNSGTLTGKTITSNVTTRFRVSPQCKPALIGSNAYIAEEAGSYTHIREYFIQNDGVSFDAADVTAHCPEYLPKNVVKLVGTPTYDILFAFSPETPRNIYFYKYHWMGDEKVQSAWGTWVLPVDTLSITLLDENLFVLTSSSGQVCLNKINLSSLNPSEWEPGGIPLVCLDRRVELVGTYDAQQGRTLWTLPYVDSTTARYHAVKKTDGYPVLQPSRSGSVLSAPGDYSGVPFMVGLAYDHLIQLSQFILKDAKGAPYLFGRTTLRTFQVGYSRTGYFDVVVEVQGREPDVYQHSPFAAGCPLDQLMIGTGTFTDALIMADAREVTIKLRNASVYPSIFVNASYEGTYYARAQKI